MTKQFHYMLKVTLFFLTFVTSMCAYSASNNSTAQLSALLNNFQNMQAQFTQTIFDAQGNAIQTSSGQMALQRPGKFRWQTMRPAPQLAIADGRYVWTYDKQLQQVTRRQQQTGNNKNSPAALLSGSTNELSAQFNIKALQPIAHTDEGFSLRPTASNAAFQNVLLYFNHGTLQVMRLTDNLDQTTVIKFRQVKINTAISPQLFRFSPPPGVDVVTG